MAKDKETIIKELFELQEKYINDKETYYNTQTCEYWQTHPYEANQLCPKWKNYIADYIIKECYSG